VEVRELQLDIFVILFDVICGEMKKANVATDVMKI